MVILGIANTLDLPERFLPKISSRLGNNKVVFKPYTADQLKKIVCSRLEEAAESGTPAEGRDERASRTPRRAPAKEKRKRSKRWPSSSRQGKWLPFRATRGASWSPAAALPSSPRRSPAELLDEKEAARLRQSYRRAERITALDLDAASRRAASRRSTWRRW